MVISQSGSYILTNDLTTPLAGCKCLDIQADNVYIDFDGHIIKLSSTSGCYAVIGNQRTNISIRNGIIDSSDYGIYFYNTTVHGNFVIERMTILNILTSGLEVFNYGPCSNSDSCSRVRIIDNIIRGGTGSVASGIRLDGVRSGLIERNSIHKTYYGIYLNASDNNLIRKNTVLSSVAVGIFLQNSNGNMLKENISSRNKSDGIDLENAHGNLLQNNITSNNTYDGIYLYNGSDNNTIIWNTSMENGWNGIYVFAGNNNTIDWNQVSNNAQYGIRFYTGTSNNVYSNNRSKVSGILDQTCAPTCANDDAGGNRQ